MPANVDNPLTRGANRSRHPHRVSNALGEFLVALEVHLDEAYVNGILLKPGGIRLAINVYEQILIALGRIPKESELMEYAEAFEQSIREVVGRPSSIGSFVKNQLTSFAQRRQVTAEVVANMREALEDPNFGKYGYDLKDPLGDRMSRFERALAEFVFQHLEINTIADLKQKAPRGTWEKVARILRDTGDQPVHKAVGLGEIRQILERSDNSSVVMPELLDTDDGFGDTQEVFSALAAITRFRNDVQHGRAVRNRRLAAVYLETFERLVEA